MTRVDGRLVREPVGHNRKLADRRLTKAQHEIDEDTYQPPESVTFSEYADRWLDGLRRRETTKASYTVTINYAKQTFGHKQLRKIRAQDIAAFLRGIESANRERHPRSTVAPNTLAKHMRQLSACFESARGERLISENPARLLPKSSRPKLERKRPSYFTDAELTRLWPELAERPLNLALAKLAVTTGLRAGELAALRWSDVRLLEDELVVSRTYTEGVGETAPKDGDPRTIDLTPQARRVLEEWLPQTTGEDLVFEREVGGYLNGGQTLDVLYAAMKRAGIPRESERGGKRTFHSLRNTFARIALENGARLEWVQGQLGHSSITLTRDVYGAWSRSAEKAEARRLVGAFAV